MCEMACEWQEAFRTLVEQSAYKSILPPCTVVFVICVIMMHKSNVFRALPDATIIQTMVSGCVALRGKFGCSSDAPPTAQSICEYLVVLRRIKSRGTDSAPGECFP